MKEFDYVIIGGGCAGLSLAYEFEINNKLKKKSLAIIEHRDQYKRDKTWSFWKVSEHSFEDCVINSWNNFTINTSKSFCELKSNEFPYQSIDSGKFYEKINLKLSRNPNISFFKSISEINTNRSIIFNSVYKNNSDKSELWQHFKGIEIETSKNIFDDKVINLMDFNCDQRNHVHFFYTLPFSKTRALIETTWLSNLKDENLMDYDLQLGNYIKNNLGIKNYKVNLCVKFLYLFVVIIPLFSSCQETKEIKKYNVSMSDSEWKNILPRLSYNVLRKSYTERAFSSNLNFNKKSGHYACRGCKNPLYSSENKYDSGSGWPSFDREIKNNIEYDVDYKIGYPRTELKCSNCGGHLGHMFNDGPIETTGKRHCINGAALIFIEE